jgi:Ca2+-binding RTX toxin-like protein
LSVYSNKESTIWGVYNNDSIIGGAAADNVDGGSGTDTFTYSSANVVEQAGSGTTDGTVINISAAAVTSTTVFTTAAKFLSGSNTEVAAGSAQYMFSNDSGTNASIIDTVSNVENVTGTNVIDYIIGSATANTIQGGDGNDFITTGTGADTVNVTDTGSGNDTVTDFTVGAGGDVISLSLTGMETDAAGNADVDLILLDDAATNTGAGAAILATVTTDFDMAALTANANILVVNLAGNVANAAALDAALISGGASDMTANGAIAAKDGFLALYDTGTDSVLAHVEVNAGVNNDAKVADVAVTDLITFKGVADCTTLTADNFVITA